ncbi:MAG: type II secretion system GspH family protein [Verrucomicrobia bacterium]|nr:type II secretion system GspH family protein [Verrucomicrobiota bacterium]MBU1856806.1 type II secretion system GspH family protein [Verrucomicrobiota bacterium]
MKKACHHNSAFCILHSAFSCAFTLIELLITIVLVGIVLLALVMSFHESLKSLERQKDLRPSLILCEDLMNEIRSKAFADLQFPANVGREEAAVRCLFDDTDDYDDWSESPPQAVEGTVMSNFTGFTRSVVVVNVPATNFNSPPLPDYYTNNFKRITVVVSNAQMSVSNVSVVSRYD